MDIAVTGSTGFLGSAITRHLAQSAHGVRALTRTDRLHPAGVNTVVGCLEEAASLRRLIDGASVVIHAASYIGSDEQLQQQVNVEGTRTLLDVADQASIEHVFYLSTAGVYGEHFPVGQSEPSATPQPRSGSSKSRLTAEQLVAERGGTILRPNLVVGPGDRWVIVPLLKFMLAQNVWISSPEVRLSVIDVDDLGGAVAALVDQPPVAKTLHVARPQPVTVRELMTPVFETIGRALPDESWSLEFAQQALKPLGVGEAQIAKIGEDNWFDTSFLWSVVKWTGALSPMRLPSVAWYAQQVTPNVAS